MCEWICVSDNDFSFLSLYDMCHYYTNYSILMAVADSARLFSAGLRISQPAIAAIKLRIPPDQQEYE
jgi:hypothetical protein